MANSKHGSCECRICGASANVVAHLSYTGQCPECYESRLEENFRGLQDRNSVPYKHWYAAYSISHPGRPRITTPPVSWTPRTDALKLRRVRDLIAAIR